MKIKKEYLVLSILIIALALYLLFQKADRSHYRLPNIPQVSTSEMTRVEISKPDGKILLEKKEGRWRISPEGYPVDTFKIKGILDTIGTLTLTTLISESKSYERYDLHKQKRISVKAWSGDELKREFDVGKVAPSFSHTFVKIARDERVYHARENFRNKFDQSVENLRDKAVLRFEEEEIRKLDIIRGKDSLSLTRKTLPVEVTTSQEGETQDKEPPRMEPIWQTPEGKGVDEPKLKRLLATLSRLNCSAYIEGRKKGDFTDPVYSIELQGTKTYSLFLFEKAKKEDKTRPAVSSDNAFPFLLPDFQSNRIMISPEELLKAPDESR
ncbi:MAG: DUF4340 domain-containing protein [Desulfobacteraceae bacterium]|jgi:hypothetical protein